MIVADTNLVAYLLIEGERTTAAREVYQRDPDWILPPLWRSELLNVLVTSVRRQVLDSEQAFSVWHTASAMLVGAEHEPAAETVLAIAIDLGLSAYDAQFVAVARDTGARLVTGDRRICRAWPEGAISIESFGAGAESGPRGVMPEGSGS